MEVFLIKQPPKRADWDTYDMAVVVDNSEEEARTIHPDGRRDRIPRPHNRDWTNDPNEVTVEYIGKASAHYVDPEVVCASFRAG